MFDVGVLLSGCGMYDGSEPQETVLLLAALGREGARAVCVAPDVRQFHVVDHRDGNEAEGKRGVLEESARLARGKVIPLGSFVAAGSDALVVPGGYGVGKSLMTGFASPGTRVEIHPGVANLLDHYLSERKPVGVISLAKLLLEAAVEDGFTERLGSEAPDRVYEDPDRRLLYTPGFLAGDRIEQIAPGIDALARRVVEWCSGEGAVA